MGIEANLRHLRLGLSVLKEKGLQHAFNRWWVSTFYNNYTPLRRLLYQGIYPLLGHDPFPNGVEIEVSTLCNLKCIMCERTHWDEPSRTIRFEEFKRIVDQFPRLRYFAPSGIGENLLNKDFFRMLRYVRSKWKHCYVELFDNFSLLDEGAARQLLEVGVDVIFASIDGATKETYEKIRVGSDFDRVIGNVKRLIQLRNEMGLRYPEIRLHYIVSRANIQEVIPFVDLAKEIGADALFFTQILHSFEKIRDLAVDVPQSLVESAEARGAELGISVYWNLNTEKDRPHMSQCSQWIVPFVYATGHVLPCCAMQEANAREILKANSLGNVFSDSFRKVWYSEEFKNFRKALRRGETPIICEDCPLFEKHENHNVS